MRHRMFRFLVRGLRNLTYLTAGNIVSMSISAVGFVVIANELGRENYGKLSVALSFASIFALLTLNQMSKVMIRSGSRDPSALGEIFDKTLGLKVLLCAASIALALLVLIVMPYPLDVKIVVLIFLPDLIYLAFEGYLISALMATEKMYYVALFQVINKSMFVAVAVSLLATGFGVVTVTAASVIVNLLTLSIVLLVVRNLIGRPFRFKVVWDRTIMRPTIIFSILLFAGYVATRIDVLMISILRPVSDVGTFAVVVTIIEPLSSLKNLFAISFFPIVVKLFNEEKPGWKAMAFISAGFGAIALIGAGILVLFSGTIFEIFFPDYGGSRAIFSVLVFYQAIGFATLPFTLFLQATDNEMAMLKICWIPPLLNIVLNILFLNWFGLIGIAYSTLLVYTVYLGLYVYLTWKKLIRHQSGKDIRPGHAQDHARRAVRSGIDGN